MTVVQDGLQKVLAPVEAPLLRAVMALPLVIVVAALVRTLVRVIKGKQFRPADTPISQDSEN